MKRYFLAISLLFIFLFLFKPTSVNAEFIACNSTTEQPCTFCKADKTGICIVDATQSTCSRAGYFNDASICQGLSAGSCNEMIPSGDCLEVNACKNITEACTGSNNTQGTCCDGLLCNNSVCITPATCKNITEDCPGPAGVQGGCCENLICNGPTDTNLTCKNPPAPVIGYYCHDSSNRCDPCYSDSTMPGCVPSPQYADLGLCQDACSGTILVLYSCINGECDEAQNGNFTSRNMCEKNCGNSQTSDPFCIHGDPKSGINTAIGCIPVGSGNELIAAILRIATGLGGGIALALILYGVFIVTTSAGMPDKLKAGSDIITSAIVGLIFILLSIFLVNLIGINILGIPGLS